MSSHQEVIYRTLDRHQWINTQSMCTCGWNPDRIEHPDHVAHQVRMIEDALKTYPDPDDANGTLSPEQYIAELQRECTRLEELWINAQRGEGTE